MPWIDSTVRCGAPPVMRNKIILANLRPRIIQRKHEKRERERNFENIYLFFQSEWMKFVLKGRIYVSLWWDWAKYVNNMNKIKLLCWSVASIMHEKPSVAWYKLIHRGCQSGLSQSSAWFAGGVGMAKRDVCNEAAVALSACSALSLFTWRASSCDRSRGWKGFSSRAVTIKTLFWISRSLSYKWRVYRFIPLGSRCLRYLSMNQVLVIFTQKKFLKMF